MPTVGSTRIRRIAVHSLRVLLLIIIIGLMRAQQGRIATRVADPVSIEVQHVSHFFPDAAAIGDAPQRNEKVPVLDAAGNQIGYAIQTSPDGDHVIGFSGPTNVSLALGEEDRILGIDVLDSGDTRDHVKQVLADQPFMSSLNGLSWEQAAAERTVDGVTGATLTSLAMREAILARLGGGLASLRFPEPLTIDIIRTRLPASIQTRAARVEQDQDFAARWHVLDSQGDELATVLRTSPAADNVVGYQGPTDTLIAMDHEGRVIGIVLGKSYDNEPYVTYVRDDEYFTTRFDGLIVEELASLDLQEAEIEGVSGATMTSTAVAQGIVLAAQNFVERSELAAHAEEPQWSLTVHDVGTLVVVISAIVVGMTRLRTNGQMRVALRLVVVLYLGLVTGNLVSQAMIVGWAQHGVPWRSATGLTILLIAALAIPLTTRRNLYCSHICPHGAAQQLLRGRLPWKVRLSPRMRSTLSLIPPLLLGWCIIVGMTSIGFSLVDIEPFDAYIFRVAGWATITVALVGLAASLLVPMAYCRYGCPTGALLEFVRINAKSDRWNHRDWVAVALTIMAFGLWLV